MIPLGAARQDALLTHGQFAAGCLFNFVVHGSSRCSDGVTVGAVLAPYHTHLYIITNFKGYLTVPRIQQLYMPLGCAK